jgi:hypothetical protein
LPSISFVPCVAIVYPAEHAVAIPEFADAKKIPVGRTDDAVVAMYARAHRVQALCTVPCLVEHLCSVPSVMGMPRGTSSKDRAAWFKERLA